MAKSKATKRWYGFSLRMIWPKNQEPKTWIDIFITDTIIRDVISEKQSVIELWRIHRRWARDMKGHELTLDCFTEEKNANSIKKLIRESRPLKFLQENNLLAEELETATGGERIRDIADDRSTRNWPEELKDSWPYYISGCSEMFLCLIDSLKGGAKTDIDGKDVSEIESYYTEINNRLMNIWQGHGSHAFFHHINAIFGYQPLIAKPRGIHGILASF